MQRNTGYDLLRNINSNTPDFMELNNGPTDEFLVFITGNMKKGSYAHHVVEGCNYYGEGVTWSDKFLLKKGPFSTPTKPSEPMAFELPNEHRVKILKNFSGACLMGWGMAGQIEGDLYGVPLRTLTHLDQYEGNGDYVRRELRHITFKYPQTGDIKSVKAFMYIVDWEMYEEFYTHMGYLEACNSYVEKAKAGDKDFRVYYYKSYAPVKTYPEDFFCESHMY